MLEGTQGSSRNIFFSEDKDANECRIAGKKRSQKYQQTLFYRVTLPNSSLQQKHLDLYSITTQAILITNSEILFLYRNINVEDA